MSILGEDTSHFQGTPNWALSVAAGRPFCVLKATEGTTFVDPTLATNRRNAHAAGKIVGLYHFARAGNAAAEAAFFVKTVGPLQQGEFLVLDQEVPNSVAWCQAWLDAVYKATGVRPLIYMNQSASTGLKLGNWSGVAANYGLWLAIYDNSTAQPSVPYWGAPAMKQFSDRGVVPGIAGTCDVDVFYGSTAQLLAYGYQGDDMPTADEIAAAVWNYALGARNGSGPAQAQDWLRDTRTDAGDVHGWIRGGDEHHDNIALIWAALYGQDPVGNDNVIYKAITDLAAAVKALQTGGVDPAEVAKLVLAGIKAQMSADVQQAAGQ